MYAFGWFNSLFPALLPFAQIGLTGSKKYLFVLPFFTGIVSNIICFPFILLFFLLGHIEMKDLVYLFAKEVV